MDSYPQKNEKEEEKKEKEEKIDFKKCNLIHKYENSVLCSGFFIYYLYK